MSGPFGALEPNGAYSGGAPHTPGGAKSTSTRSPSVRAAWMRSCPLRLRHSARRCPLRCRQPPPPPPPHRTARHPTTNQRGCARRRRGSPRDPPFAAHSPAAPAFIWVPEPWLVKLAPGCQSLAGRQYLAPAPDPSAPCVSRPPHTSHTPLSTAPPRFGPVATFRVAHAASPCCAGLVRRLESPSSLSPSKLPASIGVRSPNRTGALSTARAPAHPHPASLLALPHASPHDVTVLYGAQSMPGTL